MKFNDSNLFNLKIKKIHLKKLSSHSSKYSIQKILPPITSKRKKEMEEQPSSVITKFIENLSYEFIKKTDESIKISEKNFKGNKTEQTIENEETIEKTEDNKEEIKRILNKSNTIHPKSLKEKITKNENLFLSKLYRRIRTYQPHIDGNWKSKIGLNNNSSNKTYILKFISNKKDIESQVKILNDQIRILDSNISYFKLNILPKNNFLEAFKSLSIKTQVSINKNLEETCGILVLLPQILLANFYHFIEKMKDINIPDKEKFQKKYIFDEVECLYFNNNLLGESLDFFKKCFESFITLTNEVEDMNLTSKTFENINIIIEKARFNINAVISSCENAILNYETDTKIVDKILKRNHKQRKFQEPIKLVDKVYEQYNFKNNSERQQKLRIEHALKINEEKENQLFKKENRTNSFKSILHNKLIDKLLTYSTKDIRKQIHLSRIREEMKPYKGDYGKVKVINFG